MTNPTPTDSSQFRFRLPPVESQIALGIGAAVLGMCAIQFEEFFVSHLLMLLALFIVGVFTRWTWAIYVMLGTFIFLHYFLIHPHLKYKLYTIRFPDVLVTLTLILWAAICFRFVESGRYLQSFYPNAKLGEKPDPESRNEFPSLLGGRWWAIPTALLMATVLLTAFPFDMRFFEKARLQQVPSRMIFFVLMLFFGWFICRSVVGLVIRRRMETVQADVQCRSLIAKEMWKDVYPVEKRKVKLQSRD